MKILIIIESGIGNAIFLTPLIKILHQVYAGSEITLLSSRYRQEGRILEGWKYLKDSIYSANELDPNYFDKVLISPMYGSNFDHFIERILKDKIFHLNCGRTINWEVEHEVEVNMRIVRAEGYLGKIPPTEVKVISTDTKMLNKKNFRIGFHAGCLNHPDYAKKLWLTNRWDKLAKRLEKDFNAQVIWFGAGDDYYNKKIGLNLVNKYKDIRRTAYLISKCDMFISLDSGLMHTANALDVPTIGLFGPTLVSKNSPWNISGEVIQSKKCKECYFGNLFTTCKDNKCMKEITVDEVIANIKRRFDKKKKKERKKGKIKLCLVACRQLGESLRRTLDGMENVEFFKYDYLLENYDFSERANECDLVLVLHGAIQFDLNILNKIKVKKVLWFNDNIIRYKVKFEEMVPYFDEVFTINKDNPPGIGFIPCGIDATQFEDLRLERDIDVSFIGNLYNDERIRWLSKVKNYIDISHFQGIGYGEYVSLLNRSKITINQHYNEYGANMRFYEAMACKSLMITDRVVGIPKDFKEGEHYIVYENVPDLVKKIKYYLNNEKERLKITNIAYRVAVKNHKYSDRLNQLFEEVLE